MIGLPAFHAQTEKIHHADDAVIDGARISGTHNGPFAGIPATGRGVDVPMVAIFEFEGDRLMCEKVYYDVATVLVQMGVLPESAPAG
jgi:predicted ester cyclase